MPSLNVKVDADPALARLERVGPEAREALKDALGELADAIGQDARARAQAHIRYLGKKAPGSYVESIHAGVADKDHALVGYVRSAHPLAHLMELGTRAHDIYPGALTDKSDAMALAFEGAAGLVFAKHVLDPGMRAFPAILPAFESARDGIEDALKSAVADAVGD